MSLVKSCISDMPVTLSVAVALSNKATMPPGSNAAPAMAASAKPWCVPALRQVVFLADDGTFVCFFFRDSLVLCIKRLCRSLATDITCRRVRATVRRCQPCGHMPISRTCNDRHSMSCIPCTVYRAVDGGIALRIHAESIMSLACV